MNAHDFVNAIRTHVMEAAASDSILLVTMPPGRSPERELVELNAWYSRLAKDDQVMLERFAAIVAHAATFGMFAVLDQSRKIDPASDGEDYFELRHVRTEATDILCGPNGAVLHELL